MTSSYLVYENTVVLQYIVSGAKKIPLTLYSCRGCIFLHIDKIQAKNKETYEYMIAITLQATLLK